MQEIDTSKLKVGDIVYVLVREESGRAHIGDYYRKEVVKRITPKRTKIVTDRGEYKSSKTFFEYCEEMEVINQVTLNKEKILDARYTLPNLLTLKAVCSELSNEDLSRLSDCLEEIIGVLKGSEKEVNNDEKK